MNGRYGRLAAVNSFSNVLRITSWTRRSAHTLIDRLCKTQDLSQNLCLAALVEGLLISLISEPCNLIAVTFFFCVCLVPLSITGCGESPNHGRIISFLGMLISGLSASSAKSLAR